MSANKAPRMQAPRMQYAALPYRRVGGSALEIMLITSRDTGRWVIPKGWPGSGLAPRQSAAREAHEEGGLVGQIGKQPIGRYHYDKRLADGRSVHCAVDVFPLEVERQLRSWPERKERRTRWFRLEEAAAAVAEPELAKLIRDLERRLG